MTAKGHGVMAGGGGGNGNVLELDSGDVVQPCEILKTTDFTL